MNKTRMILVLIPLFVVTLLLSPAKAQALDMLSDEGTFPMPHAERNESDERKASLGENRGEIPEGSSEIWTYEGQAGDVLTIKAEADKPANATDAEERRQAGLLDMMLIIYAPDGTIIAKADDIQPGTVTDAVIEGLQLPADGTYKIEALGLEKQGSGTYTLTLEANNATPPDPTPTIDPDWPTLTIENGLEDTICYVYIWPVSADELGDERLGTKQVILANDSHQWAVAPEEYNIAVSDCYGNTLDVTRQFDVTEPSTLTISPPATDGPAAQCAEGVQLALGGRPDEALPLVEAGFAARESATFAEPDDEGICALILAKLRKDSGNSSGALEAYQVALHIFQTSGNRKLEGVAVNNIGELYRARGQYELALEQFNQALYIRGEIGDQAGEGRTANNIAGIYLSRGQYELALEQFNQALHIMREAGNRRDEGFTLNNIGGIYDNQGQYELALERFNQALYIMREEGNHRGEGATLNNIGGIYREQGQYELALEQYQKALEIYHEVGDLTGEGATTNNIGVVYRTQGQYELALEQYEKALEIRRKVGDRAGEGATLHNIGFVYHDQGQYELALEQYQKALEIRREIGDRTGEGRTLNNIGGVYENQGQYELALEQYQKALEIRREVGDRAGEGRTLNNIGFVYEQQGQAEEALVHYERAMEAFEAVRAIAGSDQERASFIAQYVDTYQRAIGLYYRQGQEENAFYSSERGRARSFLDSLATGQVQLSDDDLQELLTRERDVYAQRLAIRGQLVRARAQNPPDPELVASFTTQLEALDTAYSQVQADIEARGEELAALVPIRNDLPAVDDIQALLDEQTTLISYWVLENDGTLAFILTSDELNVVSLGVGSQDLTEQITAFYQIFTDPFFEQKEQETNEKLQQLHEWLITPLKPHINTPGVTIIPHGILHYLPFAALTDGESYFSDQYVLSSLPSVSVLPSIQENRPPDTTIESVLALGNPTFDSELAKQEGLTLSNLPFAKQEVEALTNLFGDKVEALFGKEATESALRQAGQANILHIAAHAIYNPDQPLDSKLILAGDATNNGFLEVGEVYGLGLRDSMLVVLSACETGLRSLNKEDGESVITDGDEIVALNRAFLFAGTPTVISTLWSVYDVPSALLNERFYTHLQAGYGKAEALRQAQIDVREEYPHPYYWAAFVLTGDGGNVTDAGLTEMTTSASTPVARETVEIRETSTPVATETVKITETNTPVATKPAGEGGLGSSGVLGVALLLGLLMLGLIVRWRIQRKRPE